jgi:hypothetical protein
VVLGGTLRGMMHQPVMAALQQDEAVPGNDGADVAGELFRCGRGGVATAEERGPPASGSV